MLKVTKLSTPAGSSAANIATYYKEEERDLNIQSVQMMSKDQSGAIDKTLEGKTIIQDYGDYVLAENKEDRSLSQWGGELAKLARIDGKEVDKETLTQAMDGHFLGQSVLRRSDGVRRAGFDFTFSAPKSVSVMALLYGDSRLISAHQDAVKSAMDEVAKMIPEMRIQNPDTKELERVATEKILYAMETHKTSRELDPQLHTHAILANMGMDEQGKLRAITIDSFYENKLNKYFGSVYQAALNKSVRALGYDTHGIGNGMFEILGISKEFLQSFSTRRGQIEQSIKAFGATDANTVDKIAMYSRSVKQNHNAQVLDDLWKDRRHAFDGMGFLSAVLSKSKNNESVKSTKDEGADKTGNSANNSKSEYGFTPDKSAKAGANGIQSLTTPTTGDAAHDAIELTVGHLSRYQTQMDYNEMLSKALEDFAIDQSLNIADLKQAIESKIKNDEIVSLDTGTTTLTTKAQIDAEKRIHGQINTQVKNMRSVVNQKALNELSLNKENAQTISKVFESTKQANMLTLTGSAKDAISALIHVAENSGKRVTVLTPNNYHLQEVSYTTKRQAFSVFQWVRNQFRGDFVQTLGGFLYQQSQTNSLDNDKIIVVGLVLRIVR